MTRFAETRVGIHGRATPRRASALAGALALLAGSIVTPPAARAEADAWGDAKPTFAQVVSAHFPSWDRNHDGTLSASEIDRLSVDDGVKGPEAAAVAALKRIVRSEKYQLPTLTCDYLMRPHAAQRAGGELDRDDSNEPSVLAPEPTISAHVPDFQTRFEQCLTRIERTDHVLFTTGELQLERCHQGPLGDCFFVSVVGAAVRHDAFNVKHMITSLPEGAGYRVAFGNGREVEVGPLTDVEVAISSTTGGNGLWLAVLEKALGTMRREDSPHRYNTMSPTDAIAKGGSTGSTVSLLTGHGTSRIVLKRPVREEQRDDDGRRSRREVKGGVGEFEPAGDLDALALRVREQVGKALAEGRLVATGTADDHQPPGINSNHAYAVLSYDASRDTLKLWNPHGTAFTAHGEPGLKNGYTTRAGFFEVPVKDFVRIFNGVTIEKAR